MNFTDGTAFNTVLGDLSSVFSSCSGCDSTGINI